MANGIVITINVVKEIDVKSIGLSSATVDRINRKASNTFIGTLNKYIPRRIAQANDINLTGFSKHRIKRTLSYRKNNGRGRFWVGENDVLAQYKKGAWRADSTGAKKGRFFKKNAFIIKTRTGKKLMFVRENGKLEIVRVALDGYEEIVRKGVATAQKGVLASFKRDTLIEFAKT